MKCTQLALTLQQIKSLVNYTDGAEATEHYRDLWFFSYLCNGINFTDLITLKYSNIRNGEISFMRAKTIRTSKVKKEICAVVLGGKSLEVAKVMPALCKLYTEMCILLTVDEDITTIFAVS